MKKTSTSWHYVYILLDRNGRAYIGCTSNLKRRLWQHNAREVKSTKDALPVMLHCCFSFRYKHQAYFFEKYLKSGSGRAFVKRHFLEFN